MPLRILKWSQADQVAWIKSYLADGMPGGDELAMLVLNKSSTVLPLLEQEIEAILHAKLPEITAAKYWFSEKTNIQSEYPQRLRQAVAG